ncbi:short-chain dehydrogenase [Gracilaria domingensis]|nr:short-chain dehydrogenase [Gracilaria domingensis]
MSGNTVAITGPTKGGIGYQTALRLATFGSKVILLGRNPSKSAEATASIREKCPSAPIEHVQCDLSSLDSVTNCANSLKSILPAQLDVLVCNAGVHLSGLETTPDGYEKTFAVCALGHHKLIHMLQPKRVVWVTGDVYVFAKGMPSPTCSVGGMQAYARACLARLLLARQLKKQNEQTGIAMEVVCVHPGVINSNFAKLPHLVKRIADHVLLPVEYGSEASVLAASAKAEELHQSETLPYYHNKRGWFSLPEDDLAMDEGKAQLLFEECDKICAISRSST